MQILVGFCSLVSILHLGDISPQEGHDRHVWPLPRWRVIGQVPESEGMPCRIPVPIFRIKKPAVWKHVHAVAVVADRGVKAACVALQRWASNRPWSVARHGPKRRRRVVAARVQCNHVSPRRRPCQEEAVPSAGNLGRPPRDPEPIVGRALLQRCDGAVHGMRVHARRNMIAPLQQEARFEAAAARSGRGARERAQCH